MYKINGFYSGKSCLAGRVQRMLWLSTSIFLILVVQGLYIKCIARKDRTWLRFFFFCGRFREFTLKNLLPIRILPRGTLLVFLHSNKWVDMINLKDYK